MEQQKYQSLANLNLFFHGHDSVSHYKRWLDLNTSVTFTEYKAGNVKFEREVLPRLLTRKLPFGLKPINREVFLSGRNCADAEILHIPITPPIIFEWTEWVRMD